MRTKSKWAVCGLPLLMVAAIHASSNISVVQAVKNRDQAAARALLRERVDVNAPEPDGATALHWAVHWDDLDTAQMLIEAGARVNVRNELGITPLMLACENGSPKMIEKLLAAGADPNIVSPTGQSALMIAARTSSTDAISALLAHGANVNAKEASRNQTALIWAVAEHRPDVARVLIDHGADINARSLTINELIYRENPDPSDENAAKGQPHPVGEVIARGGSTPFLMAAREGDIASATLLLAAGANINDTAPDGTSALVIAAYSDHDAFAAFLLDHGADPNGAAAGYTALHIAVLTANSELVRALLAHGANPNAQLTMGTPVRRFEEDLVLPQSLAGATPFLVAARLAEVDIMRILAAAGANPQAATRIGVTPLMAAVVPDRRSLALRSLQAEQAANQTLEAVRLILQLGADVNETNAEGDTALHIAAWKGANAIIRLLVEKGAKLDVKNKVGQTPLSLTKNTLLSESPRRRLRSTANLLQELGATK